VIAAGLVITASPISSKGSKVTRRELALEATINRLDRFDLIILDDLAYVSKFLGLDQHAVRAHQPRYERRLTSSLPISRS
jgi:DNA replication protein DnaC